MNRWQASAAVVALCVAVSGGAWAQVWAQRGDRDDQRGRYGWQDRQQRDRDGDRDDNNGWYGQRDRDRDRRDNAYPNGPYAYPNGPYGYGNGRYGYGGNQAYQIGYQDGLNDGRDDAGTGHSFRPQQDSNYKHADRGYNSSFGDKNGYKQVYRNGYMQGYQAGYGDGRYGYGGYGYGGWPR